MYYLLKYVITDFESQKIVDELYLKISVPLIHHALPYAASDS